MAFCYKKDKSTTFLHVQFSLSHRYIYVRNATGRHTIISITIFKLLCKKLHNYYHNIWRRSICSQDTLTFMYSVHISPGPRFNIKMSSYQYRKSHCGDKTAVRSSYLHNGNPILIRWHIHIESGLLFWRRYAHRHIMFTLVFMRLMTLTDLLYTKSYPCWKVKGCPLEIKSIYWLDFQGTFLPI